jgi:uncharacterized protein involved in exopolysaccharide biosynthesis
LKETIAAVEKEQAKALAEADSKNPDDVSNPAVSTVDQSLRRQLQAIDLDIANFKGKINETSSQIRHYQAKVEDSPKREQELLSLNRDYSNLKENYNSLLNKKYQADLSVSAEKKQKGEQFRIIDSAKIPERPVEPDTKKIILMTLLVGLGLGCGLAYLMETMDTSYKIPDDAVKELELPALVSFPLILTENELIANKRRDVFAYTGVGAAFILSVIGILITVKGVSGAMDFVKGLFLNV